MKRAPLFFILIGSLILFAGCKKPASDADGIRAGINQHLASLKTINLSAMDMTINSYSIQGKQAQAVVEFRPKTGAPQGAGMQVNYTLAKQNDGTWVVEQTTPMGGSIQHPAPGENPHQSMSTGSTPGPGQQLPNFSDLVDGASGAAMPPGHPPVNQQGSASSAPPAYKPQ
ncbi:MAG: hypothetical protein ACRD4Y_09310 [Candidatus Acidiferrales bacterium]